MNKCPTDDYPEDDNLGQSVLVRHEEGYIVKEVLRIEIVRIKECASKCRGPQMHTSSCFTQKFDPAISEFASHHEDLNQAVSDKYDFTED